MLQLKTTKSNGISMFAVNLSTLFANRSGQISNKSAQIFCSKTLFCAVKILNKRVLQSQKTDTRHALTHAAHIIAINVSANDLCIRQNAMVNYSNSTEMVVRNASTIAKCMASLCLFCDAQQNEWKYSWTSDGNVVKPIFDALFVDWQCNFSALKIDLKQKACFTEQNSGKRLGKLHTFGRFS